MRGEGLASSGTRDLENYRLPMLRKYKMQIGKLVDKIKSIYSKVKYGRRRSKNPSTSSNRLSINDIRERLRIKNNEIIEEIYKTCYELIDKMEESRKNLDSKSAQLISIIGVCLTIILTATLVITSEKNIWAFVQKGKSIIILYFVTILFLFIAFGLAIHSIMPRSDYKTISDKDIFNPEILKEDSNYYKRYMASHYWCIYSNTYRINEKKGAFLKGAYRLFFIALVFFFFAVIGTFFKL